MNNFPPKCVLIQMLEHSMYLLKNTELFDCFKKSWAPTVLEFGLFFLNLSYLWRNQGIYGLSWPSAAGTESWIRFLQRLPGPAFITGNISGKQNSQHVYSSGSKHLKEENSNRNSDLFLLCVPLQSLRVEDGVAGVALLCYRVVLLPAIERDVESYCSANYWKCLGVLYLNLQRVKLLL